MKPLKDVFNSKSTFVPGQDERYMKMSEFISLVQQSGVVNDTFGAKEIGPLFNMSMQT
jgi:hypothetical protein